MKPCAADDAFDRAEEALTLLYIENDIYYPVTCSSKQHEERMFVLCRPSGLYGKELTVGGLYEVRVQNGEPSICPVNGKAMNHLDRVSGLTDADVRPVDTFKPCRIDDIPSVFALFQ